jgi:hypothetical protein
MRISCARSILCVHIKTLPVGTHKKARTCKSKRLNVSKQTFYRHFPGGHSAAKADPELMAVGLLALGAFRA